MNGLELPWHPGWVSKVLVRADAVEVELELAPDPREASSWGPAVQDSLDEATALWGVEDPVLEAGASLGGLLGGVGLAAAHRTEGGPEMGAGLVGARSRFVSPVAPFPPARPPSVSPRPMLRSLPRRSGRRPGRPPWTSNGWMFLRPRKIGASGPGR